MQGTIIIKRFILFLKLKGYITEQKFYLIEENPYLKKILICITSSETGIFSNTYENISFIGEDSILSFFVRQQFAG